MSPTQQKNRQFLSSSLKIFLALSAGTVLWILLYTQMQVSGQAQRSIIVTSREDDVVENDDQCTLREAIIALSNDTSNQPTGDCKHGHGNYTITFDSSVTGTIILKHEISITSNIVISGPGAMTLTLSSNGNERIFNIISRTQATISGLTIANGQAASGGGIYNNGLLTINKSIIHDNQARGRDDSAHNTRCADGYNACGGGIYNAGILMITDSAIVSNTSLGGNGSSCIRCPSNQAGKGNNSYGGGIYNEGKLTIQNSTISHNRVKGGRGGNVFFSNQNGLIQGGDGGDAYGGGIYQSSGDAALVHITISQNDISPSSGGIDVFAPHTDITIQDLVSGSIEMEKIKYGSPGTANGSNIFGLAGNIFLKNSILAGNSADKAPDCGGSLTSQDYNLITSDCHMAGIVAHNVIDPNLMLSSLQDNGAGTLTQALLRFDQSKAYNAIPSIDCLPSDQRDVTRKGEKCDIGAYESDDLQVRVYYPNGKPVSGASLYLLKNGQTGDYTPIEGLTDEQGYSPLLRAVNINDSLIVMAPTMTTQYTGTQHLYLTNAKPIAEGLSRQPLLFKRPAVVTITTNVMTPLMLFDLTIALEWDARNDPFMGQLNFDLKRTSRALYDWTNGQAALGKISIYQDARRYNEVNGVQPWRAGNIRIYASNRLRPNSDIGGVVTITTTDKFSPSLTYQSGHVQIGTVWNRYGNATGEPGEDWPLALAHELGHYLFFLQDNYLGWQNNKLVLLHDACPGVMTDPYIDQNSEFEPAGTSWQTNCQDTIAEHNFQRADWTTINDFYRELKGPITGTLFTAINPGPNVLPLPVTQILQYAPSTENAPTYRQFNLVRPDGAPVEPSDSARAFLFQENRVINLGHPVIDQIFARGARPGNRLCLYEVEAQQPHLGCTPVTDGNNQLKLANGVDVWQPNVVVKPGLSATSLSVEVDGELPTNVDHFKARFYSVDTTETFTITLVHGASSSYTGTFPTLAQAPSAGYVNVWEERGGARLPQEVMIDYALGGSPCCSKSLGHAPLLSADGQVILYSAVNNLTVNQFYTLQTLTHIPDPPSWATAVGQAYRLAKSTDAPSFQDNPVSINFQYLDRDVPSGEENFLHVYYYNEEGSDSSTPHWEPLTAITNTKDNSIAVQAPNPGLYALMSSIEIPLKQGWNNFGYPVQGTRDISEALASIVNSYTVVLDYVPAMPVEPWHMYVAKTPSGSNDLSQLEFGLGYWIYMAQTATLYLKGPSPIAVAETQSSSSQVAQSRSIIIPNPKLPAVYIGDLSPASNFKANMLVQAKIGDRVCGQAQTQNQDGRIVFAIKVEADDGGSYKGCGIPGSKVTFVADTRPMQTKLSPPVFWGNKSVKLNPISLEAEPSSK